MSIKKIIAAIAAGAMALTISAVGAFAETVEIDAENPGQWSSSGAGIKKADLEAVGGDVRIVLTVETQDPYGLADQFLVNPIDYDNGWKSQTDFCTSDTAVAKTDGWICVPQDATTIEFVLSADAIPDLGDDGLCFSNCNVLVKSAEYELGEAQAEMVRVSDADGKAYCFGEYTVEGAAEETSEEPAEETSEEPAEESAEEAVEETVDAPASDDVTAPAATGNASSIAIVSVMAIAAAAAVASKKSK